MSIRERGLPFCAPSRARVASNPEFGDDGAATITIPSSLQPTDPAEGGFPAEGMWVNAIAPRNGGGAIVAGVYEGDWVVGEVTASGTVDQTFGSNGWVLLPLPGQVTAILQEPSGRIVIAETTVVAAAAP
jgi:hypothetical protein